MATFNHISGAEPSTVTFKLATVTQTRNSSAMHQEIMALGDPDTSNALAAVLNAQPASTAWGLVTRDVSTGPYVISSIQGITTIQGNSTVAPLAGSTWNVRPLQSSQADLRITAYQSTAADLNVTVAGYVAPSTVVTVAAFGSGLISSAVQAGGSSALNVRNVWSSTNTDQSVSARCFQSSAADLAATVTPAGGSTWRTQPGSTLWASSAGFHFDSSGALQIAGSFSASSIVTVSQLLDSSGGSVTAADSANNAIRVNVVAGAAGGSTIVSIGAFNSLVSSAVQAGGSSALTVRNVWSSTNADQPVSAAQAGSWNIVNITGSMSSLSTGHVTVDTGSIRVVQSSAAELLVTATLGTNLQSTAAPSSGSSGLVVRQVIDVLTAFASTSALASTTLAVVSSAANIRAYVTAYTITTTNQTAAQWGFFSSNGTLLWPMTLAALSSGVAGVNLAVSPPGYLFRTAASDALNFKTNGSTVSSVQLGVSYYLAP